MWSRRKRSGPPVGGVEALLLVDTSSWIHFLRPDGDPGVHARVETALESGDACWCPLVQLELWNGARGAHERSVLREFARVLPELAISSEVWTKASELATQARARGVTAPATDVLIAACALHHGADLETADSDFDHLAAVGDSTRLAQVREVD
ncbi:MAG: PIN domain nuclease [Gemmatimonadetes bacterium]|nr:PIN domain nuclease [Gemmatimonadota bacterium]MYE94287.1 PIN domain nuclease [Gemmatimonadota bacterium]MYJ09715.1 PIN domain nuclease [Gemmatimonadota bacterium]